MIEESNMMMFNWLIMAPEIFMVLMILIILMVDVFIKNNCIAPWLSLLTLFIVTILQILIYPHTTVTILNGMFVLTTLAEVMKLFIYILSIITIIYIKQYLRDQKILQAEFYVIFLFTVLGMQVIISANNILVLYMGLELLSLSLIGLVALNRDSLKSTEAAMKYFILSALASGILLYGISFIYGATSELQLDKIMSDMLINPSTNGVMLVFGTVFIVSGLAFKLGLVPFHTWVPDVYEGATLPVVTIIGSVTKIAAIIFVVRLLVTGLVQLGHTWAVMLEVLAILSLIVGNIVAIAQTNIKRMLGYSAIAHMAFIAFGFMTLTLDGFSAVIFYIITYAITTLAGFGVLLFLSHNGHECETLDDLSGLNTVHPIYAGILLLVMFSLAGIPPFVGFYAKFIILQALIEVGYLKLAIFAVVLSLIGAFYYLRIVKIMYFNQQDSLLQASNVHIVTRVILCCNGGLILLLGLMPNQLLQLCTYAITH